MNENILFLNMFPDYEPPETLKSVLSQAAIVAADLDPATRRISAAIHSPQYIPARILTAVQKDICQIYDLQTLELTDGLDMPDQSRARLHKAIGAVLSESNPASALNHLNHALQLDPRCGVKKDKQQLERRLRNDSR